MNYRNLNKANVRKWVKALRSGEFKRTTGRLKRVLGNGTEKFCCLGVVHEISGIPSIGQFTLSDKAARWLGLGGWVKDPAIGRTTATMLNDERKMSFNQIADRIEKYWLGK